MTGGEFGFMRGFSAVALVAGLALAGVGHAQSARPDGMDCVYLALGDDYELVAEVFLYDDLSADEISESEELIETAKAGCAAKHSYSRGQLQAVGDLGVLASAIDYLSEELLFSGLNVATVDGVLDAYDALTDDDVDAILERDWRSDAAFYGRLKTKMTGAGIPDEADLMEIAMMILDVAALSEEATFLFMIDEQQQTSAQ